MAHYKTQYPPANLAIKFDPSQYPEADPVALLGIGVIHRAVIDYWNELEKPREERDFAMISDIERNLSSNPFAQLLKIDINAILQEVRKQVAKGVACKHSDCPHNTFKGSKPGTKHKTKTK